MKKDKYYVSVQSGSILKDQGAAAYELEIMATEEEVEQLKEWLDVRDDTDKASLLRTAMAGGAQYHNDFENDSHDEALQHVYRWLYQLGTKETKQHIESMGLSGIKGL